MVSQFESLFPLYRVKDAGLTMPGRESRWRGPKPSPRRPRGSLVLCPFQFVVDEILKFSQGLRATHKYTVDEETGRGPDTGLLSIFLIARHLRREFAGCEA
jgi:hypothetical protein